MPVAVVLEPPLVGLRAGRPIRRRQLVGLGKMRTARVRRLISTLAGKQDAERGNGSLWHLLVVWPDVLIGPKMLSYPLNTSQLSCPTQHYVPMAEMGEQCASLAQFGQCAAVPMVHVPTAVARSLASE